MEPIPAAISRFLEGVKTANWQGMESYFTDDALYDGTMPGWRAQYEGAGRIVQELREEWTGRHTWSIVDLTVLTAGDTVVLELEAHANEPDKEPPSPYYPVVRIANFFRLEHGRIAEHRYYCTGEWDEKTVRHIEVHAPRVPRATLDSSKLMR